MRNFLLRASLAGIFFLAGNAVAQVSTAATWNPKAAPPISMSGPPGG